MVANGEAALGRDEIPIPQDDRVPHVSLPARVYCSTATHRLLPARVSLALAAQAGPLVRKRRNPAELADAERFMRELLVHTHRVGEAKTLAAQWLAEKSRLRELFWRPGLIRRSSVAGLEHWRAARADGRGCVLAYGHMSATWSVPAILAAAEMPVYIVIGPHYWEPMPPGYEGLSLLHLRTAYLDRTLGPPRVVSSTGSPERLKALVGRGEAVAIAWDAPGRAPTPFLGRTVALGGAAARLAFDTGCQVVPIVPERDGTRLVLRCYPPLDATAYDGAGALRAAIARSFEPIYTERAHEVELAWIPSPVVTAVEPAAHAGPGAAG
jgi:lauroyl/myristoyl acyltransferase